MARFDVAVTGARLAIYPGPRGSLVALVLDSNGNEVAEIAVFREAGQVTPVTHLAARDYCDAAGIEHDDDSPTTTPGAAGNRPRLPSISRDQESEA